MIATVATPCSARSDAAQARATTAVKRQPGSARRPSRASPGRGSEHRPRMRRTSCASELRARRARVHEYATRTSITPHPWGPGRVDALTMIVDRTTATLTGIRENWSTGNAPVKPPFLWNAPQGLVDAVERALRRSPIGRNFGETMGVFCPLISAPNLPPKDCSSRTPRYWSLRGSRANWNAWRRRAGRRTCSAKLTATRPRRARHCSWNIAQAATTPGLIAGPNRTNTASVSSSWD